MRYYSLSIDFSGRAQPPVLDGPKSPSGLALNHAPFHDGEVIPYETIRYDILENGKWSDFIFDSFSIPLVNAKGRGAFGEHARLFKWIPCAILESGNEMKHLSYEVMTEVPVIEAIDLNASGIDWDGDKIFSIYNPVFLKNNRTRWPKVFRARHYESALVIAESILERITKIGIDHSVKMREI